jgi:Cu/Ag efflux protein CusF
MCGGKICNRDYPNIQRRKEVNLMKKIIAIVVALIFVLAFTSASFAAAKTHSVTGEVTAVDSAAKTVTLKAKKGEVVISIAEKTSIKEGKEKKSLADIKAGDKVTVMYTEADGKMTAKSITLKGAMMKHEKKKTEKKMEEKAAPAPAPAAPAKKAPAAAGY